jgi:PAS domain S-box-containing protein
MKSPRNNKEQPAPEIDRTSPRVKRHDTFARAPGDRPDTGDNTGMPYDSKKERHRLNTLLNSIIENIPNMIFLKDASELRFVRFNRAGEELLGYKRSELIGKNDYDFFPKKQADFFIKKDRQVLSGRKILDIPEEPIHTRKKGERILHTKKVPILGENGKPLYLLGISDDITEYKKAYVQISELEKARNALKESETRYRALFESANDAIFLADAETGIIKDANKKAEELIDYPSGRIVGMHYLDLHPKEDRALYRMIFDTHACKKKAFNYIAFVTNRKGKRIPVQISVSIIRIKGRRLIIGVFNDITELKEIEDRLREDKSSLESLVARERKNLEMALNDLENAKRLADIGSLASMVAHELRNPLGVIKTAVYNIRHKAVAACTKDIKDHLDNIDKKIYESDHIISSLLSYSRVLSPSYKNVSIGSIINECADVFRQRYSKLDVRLAVDYKPANDVRIKADKVQIACLLSNILDNACQALSGNAGKVKLACGYHKKENTVSISITDNGIGLSKKDIAMAFDPFFSLKPKGIGLGLALCRQIVTLHNGNIGIQSKKTKGTTVTIVLPVNIN